MLAAPENHNCGVINRYTCWLLSLGSKLEKEFVEVVEGTVVEADYQIVSGNVF